MRTCYVAIIICLVLPLMVGGKTYEQRQRRKSRSARAANSVVQKEMYCDAEVVPKQVLFKLHNCSDDLDPKTIADKLTAIARKSSDTNETIAVAQLDSQCRYLGTSSRRTVSDFMAFFQKFITNDIKTQVLLKQSGLDDFEVENVEPNFKIYINDYDSPSRAGRPTTGTPWWFGKDFPGANAVTAWKEYGHGSSAVVVAVLDTGIFADHPALSTNTWKAPSCFSLKVGREIVHCEKGSVGFNATTTDPKSMCIPDDDRGHGTHVAGIIGAWNGQRDNPIGLNSNVKLMALKVFDGRFTTVGTIIRALEFALRIKDYFGKDADVRVLNNSYTLLLKCGDLMRELRGKVEETNKRGMLFVAASGERQPNPYIPNDPINDNDINHRYPAGFYELPNVISVTALDELGSLVVADGDNLSNYGKKSVLLGAPGEDILSTDLLGHGGGFYKRSGTSMATPFVSGAAALLFSVPGCSDLCPEKVKEAILKGAAYTPALNGKTATNGRLDIYASIASCTK